MKNKLLSLIAGSIVLAPSLSFAVGLGSVRTYSNLNERLSAEIPVLSLPGKGHVNAGLAPNAIFAKSGVARTKILDEIKFSLIERGGRTYVRLTSAKQISAPYLNFIVQLKSLEGPVYREYAIFLDPPRPGAKKSKRPVSRPYKSTKRNSKPKVGASLSSSVKNDKLNQNIKSKLKMSTSKGGVYGPVRKGETLWSIASHVRPSESISVKKMLSMLKKANSRKLSRGLPAGAMLNVPLIEGYSPYTGGYAELPVISKKKKVNRKPLTPKLVTSLHDDKKKQNNVSNADDVLNKKPKASNKTDALKLPSSAKKNDFSDKDLDNLADLSVNDLNEDILKKAPSEAVANDMPDLNEEGKSNVAETAIDDLDLKDAVVAADSKNLDVKDNTNVAQVSKNSENKIPVADNNTVKDNTVDKKITPESEIKNNDKLATKKNTETKNAKKIEAIKDDAKKTKQAVIAKANVQANKEESNDEIPWVPIATGAGAVAVLGGLLAFAGMKKKKKNNAVVLLDDDTEDFILDDTEDFILDDESFLLDDDGAVTTPVISYDEDEVGSEIVADTTPGEIDSMIAELDSDVSLDHDNQLLGLSNESSETNLDDFLDDDFGFDDFGSEDKSTASLGASEVKDTPEDDFNFEDDFDFDEELNILTEDSSSVSIKSEASSNESVDFDFSTEDTSSEEKDMLATESGSTVDIEFNENFEEFSSADLTEESDMLNALADDESEDDLSIDFSNFGSEENQKEQNSLDVTASTESNDVEDALNFDGGGDFNFESDSLISADIVSNDEQVDSHSNEEFSLDIDEVSSHDSLSNKEIESQLLDTQSSLLDIDNSVHENENENANANANAASGSQLKLDLAASFISLSNNDRARKILESVLEEGTKEEAEKATELLAKIG